MKKLAIIMEPLQFLWFTLTASLLLIVSREFRVSAKEHGMSVKRLRWFSKTTAKSDDGTLYIKILLFFGFSFAAISILIMVSLVLQDGVAINFGILNLNSIAKSFGCGLLVGALLLVIKQVNPIVICR